MSEFNETSDSLQAGIKKLQEKLLNKQVEEEGEAVQKIRLPLATLELKINKNNSVRRQHVTPPEAAFLVAEHNARNGGMPIVNLELEKNEGEQAYIEVDPRAYRTSLMSRYHPKKITTMFPGLVPTFPTSFRIAMNSGLETKLPAERMLDYELVPATGGDSNG